MFGWSRSGTVGTAAGKPLVASEPAAPGVRAHAVDVSDADAVARAFQLVAQSEGRVDAVVHAAGTALAGPLEHTSAEEARDYIAINLLGAIHMSQGALPHLRAAAPSTLLMVSSLAGEIALPYQALYTAAKFGLEGLCQSLRFEVGRLGVRLVVVRPGSVATPLTDHRRLVAAGRPYVGAGKAIALNDADERAGIRAETVAAAVAAAVEGSDQRLTIAVGHLQERIAVPLRRVLPASWFHRLLATRYEQ